ncbi:uncharacterized protein LOC130140201 isoform X2 [Syzygium oleosum]|nr:uncharacterized protein LOC130140201 isoform X2 [Syzygium oleosum]XP_056174942.1 uncharacterized protein LOC130140201 isoform X2 [Syzygium oleosum]XP_056174943.1 uncharacterized protein LOC130140201 isoform X2 [Syzygium oleosum]
MDKENNFPEKNSSVNVIIALPPPSDSSSALENSNAQPYNELNPLPAKRRKRNRKKKRKIQETSTTQGDIGAEVPSNSVLQANEPDVKDNITCSSGNSHQSLDDEKIRPTGETSCLTMKQKRKIEKRKLRSRRKKEARLSRKSSKLTEVPNNVSRVAELDENFLKESSSTSGKQSDIKKNFCSLEKEVVHGEAHTKETSFHSDEAHISHLSDGKPEQVEERIQAASAQASMGIFNFFLSLSSIGPRTLDMEDMGGRGS